MPLLTLHVDNLGGRGCASSIRRRLGELPFVDSVVVDPQAGTVSVTHDGSGDRKVVAERLFALGYPEHDAGGSLQEAGSYVRCAIGRLSSED